MIWAASCTRWRCRPGRRKVERRRNLNPLRRVSSFSNVLARGSMKKMVTATVLMFATGFSAQAQQASPNGVKTLSPPGAIKPTGTWNVGTRAGDFVFVAGMRGIDPATNQLVQGDEARIRQGFLNMKLIAESEGATLRDAARIVVYVTDMFRFRPLVNKVQEELWGAGALSAAHHHRGPPAQSGRYFRGRGHVLRPGQKMRCRLPAPWAGGLIWATYIVRQPDLAARTGASARTPWRSSSSSTMK